MFLAHAYLDRDLVAATYLQFEDQGFRVYVDWIDDPELDRTQVTAENAATIRQRIRNSSSVIFAVSPNSGESVWMPWEVGFGDGGGKKVAVLPILKDGALVAQSETHQYLGLYPTVDWATGKGTESITSG